jgi:hypothetical protein
LLFNQKYTCFYCLEHPFGFCFTVGSRMLAAQLLGGWQCALFEFTCPVQALPVATFCHGAAALW